MGEAVEIIFLQSFSAPHQYAPIDRACVANFQYKCQIVGIDVVESGDNCYTLNLVCIRDQFAAPNPNTRFFKITNGTSNPVLNNDVMYIGAAQIRTFHDNFVSDPQNMHVDMGKIYTVHVFEESVS
jgi:hypothetical protein